MYSNLKTYLVLFGGVFALSMSAIFVTLADAPSAVIAFYRMLFAGTILLPFMLSGSKTRGELKSVQKKQWLQILAAGFFLALHYVLWFESLNYTSIASSTVLVCLQPLFSIALERFADRKKIKPVALLGCFVALCGSFIIGFGDFRISGMSLWGDILAFVAAGLIALYYYFGAAVRQSVSAVTYSSLGYLVSASILLVYILIQGEPFFGYSSQTWMSFAGLAVVSSIGGQFIFNLLLKNLSASAVTMSILGEPIGACILAYFIFNDTVSLQQFIGIAVIIAGMAIFYCLPNRKTK